MIYRKKNLWTPGQNQELAGKKLNFDASFHEEGEGAWGAVLRDDNGAVILSAWGQIHLCLSAECAEATAGLESVKCIIQKTLLDHSI